MYEKEMCKEENLKNLKLLNQEEKNVKAYEEIIDKEKKEHEKLINKIKAMESKVMFMWIIKW